MMMLTGYPEWGHSMTKVTMKSLIEINFMLYKIFDSFYIVT